MRWCFVDRVESFEPWATIIGRKTVSLEEYSLLEPFGLKGWFPPGLIVESCVELARWLVSYSSNFSLTAVVKGISDFRLEGTIGMGEGFTIRLAVTNRSRKSLGCDCEVDSEGGVKASGKIEIGLLPLPEMFRFDEVKSMGGELLDVS